MSAPLLPRRRACSLARRATLVSLIASALLPVAAVGQSVPVIAARIGETTDTTRVAVTGSGRALRAATLRPAAAGEVASVSFGAGERVREGQVLLRLVDRSQRLDVDLAQSQRAAARQLLDRYRRTRGSGAVPGSVVDDAVNRLRDAEIALGRAREALADRVVRAPFDGTIGLANVMRGDRVTPDTVIATLDDRAVIRVAFAVPERYLGRLAVGQPLAVSNVAFPARVFDGRIAQIDSRVDPIARDVEVLGNVGNADDLLRPGMSFDVMLALSGGTHPSVPPLALQWDGQGAHVWVLRGAVANRVPVRLVRRMRDRVLIEGAVSPGDPVVVEGFHRLRPGSEVRIVEWADEGPVGRTGSESGVPAAGPSDGA